MGRPPRGTLAGLHVKFKSPLQPFWRRACPFFVGSSTQGALMFNIGTDTSQSGSPSRSFLQNWPLAILFAGLGLNVVWIVGIAWLVVKLAVQLLAG